MAKGYAFKDLYLAVFDIHPTPGILSSAPAAYFQNGFDALTDPVKYRQLFEAGIPNSRLLFRGLPKTDKHGHFWNSYSAINGGDPWKLQLPFVCKDIKTKISMNLANNGLEVRLRPEIYLSALGWSTNITFRLRGNFKNSQLIDLIHAIISPDYPAPPFTVNNTAQNIKGVLNAYKDLLYEIVYKKDNPPHKGMKILRHVVIGINQYEGQVTRYLDMTPGDQGLMRSLLFGKSIDANQEVDLQRTRPLLFTQITNINFALTDFEHGTLVFPQREALSPFRTTAALCLAANIKNCIMMAYLMWQFCEESNRLLQLSEPGERQGTALADVLKNVRNNLRLMPTAYVNQYCKSLFLNHKYLQRFRSAAPANQRW